MKYNLRLFVLFFGVMLFVASCKKPVPDLALFIPKDAASVFEIDSKAITDKIASSGIGIDSLANMFFKKNDEYALRWNDIKNSGIDLSKPIFIFTTGLSSMQRGTSVSMGVIATINDKDKLVSFLKKQKPGGDILSESKYQYLALGNDYVAGWNDKVLIISMVTGGNSSPGTYNNGKGTLSQQQLTTAFTQDEAASIASVGEFRDMLAKPGDVHFWSNSSARLNSIPMLGMTKLTTLFQDTYTEGTIDFENGKAVAAIETHINKTLAEMLNKYPSKTIDKSMVTNYSQPVDGFAAISFNPKVLIDILHYLGFDTMADGYVSQMGFTTSDVMNAFSGDIVFIMSDVFSKNNNTPDGINMNTKNGQFILNMRIGDKVAFDKVMNGLVGKNILMKNGDEYQLGMFGGHDFVIEIANNSLLAGSGDELIKSYETNSNKSNLPSDIDKELSNKSGAMYVDISGLLKNFSTSDTSGKAVVQVAQSTFKNFIYTGEKTDDKTLKGDAVFNFVNTNENSLASLVKFISIAHQESERKHEWNKYPPLSGLKDSLQNDETSPDNDSD